MPFERFFGANGEETDGQGVPYREIAEIPVLRRWKFLQWLFHLHPEQKTPQEYIPTIKPRSQLEMRRLPFHRPGI